MLTLKTYAHAMREEEADRSFADFGAPDGPRRPLARTTIAATKTAPS